MSHSCIGVLAREDLQVWHTGRFRICSRRRQGACDLCFTDRLDEFLGTGPGSCKGGRGLFSL